MRNKGRVYLKIIQNLSDPIIILDAGGQVENLNVAAANLLRDVYPAFAEADANKDALPGWMADAVEKKRLGVSAPPREYLAIDTPGGKRHFEIEVEEIGDGDSGLHGHAVILHDITELKQAENAIRYRSGFARLVSQVSSRLVGVRPDQFDPTVEEVLQRVANFVDCDFGFMCQFDNDGLPLALTHSWSQDAAAPHSALLANLIAAHSRSWGHRLKTGEFIAVPATRAMESEEQLEKSLLEAVDIQCLLEVPMGFKNKIAGFIGIISFHGERTWTEDHVNLLRIIAQLLTNALQHERIEEALANERHLLRTVIDNLPDYIFAKDAQSRFMLNNIAHLRLLKAVAQEELSGKSDYDIFPKELADQYYADEQHVIETGQPLVNREESVLTEEGKQRWLLTTKVPLRDSEGRPQGIVGMSRDITLRKEMAEAIEQHARLLEQANDELHLRNQELDEFTYIASHDLQEPLRKLIAFSDALREDMSKGETSEVERDLHIITSAAQRMQTLVRDLLALSRSSRQNMDWEEIDLNECVTIALDTLEYRINQAKAEIIVCPLPTVTADKTLLVQLFQNLIGNALKFQRADAPRVTVTCETGEHVWTVGVADNGIGIKPEYCEQIFAPFKRLHGRSEYEGTGIGLAICRKIAERHGGKIWVESVPGEGSHFKFTLAVHQGDAAT